MDNILEQYKALTESEDVKKGVEFINRLRGGSSYPIYEGSSYDNTFSYNPYSDYNIYEQLNKHRADSQSNWDKFGNMLGRGIAKAGISIVEPFGYVADLEQIFTDVNTVEEEYGNWFNRLLIKGEEALDRAMPIYTESERPTIGSADWFFKNGDQMIKSVGYFVPGLAFAKGAGLFLKASGIVDGVINAAMSKVVLPSLVSVIANNYGEHMRSAYEHFKVAKDDYYNKFYNENLEALNELKNNNQISEEEYNKALVKISKDSNDEAKLKASVEASDIVKQGKFNIPLELVEYITLFKYLGGTRSMGNVGLNRFSAKNILGILKDGSISGTTEYLQEVNTGFMESEAERKKNIALGVKQEDNSSIVDRYFSRLGTYESLTEGLSGFIGGAGMQVISTIASRSARNEARDIQKQLSLLENDGEKFNKLIEQDAYNLIIRSAKGGKLGSVIETFDSISKLSEQEAANLKLNPDYKEKATEFKNLALEVEKSYNNLSLEYQDDPISRDVLLNKKINSFIARREIYKLEKSLPELLSNLNNDEIENPLFKVKEISSKINYLQSLLIENDNLLSKLDDKYIKRTIETNESADEIEKRSELIYNELESLKLKQIELLNNYLSKSEELKAIKAKKEKDGLKFEPLYFLDKSTGEFNISLNSNDKDVLNIHNKINKYLSEFTDAEKPYFTALHSIEYYKSLRDNSERTFNQFLANPSILKDINKSILDKLKSEHESILEEINSANLETIDNLSTKYDNPVYKKIIENRKKVLLTEKEKLDKQNNVNNEASKSVETTVTPPITPKPNTQSSTNTIQPETQPITQPVSKQSNLIDVSKDYPNITQKVKRLEHITDTNDYLHPEDVNAKKLEFKPFIDNLDKLETTADIFDFISKNKNISDSDINTYFSYLNTAFLLANSSEERSNIETKRSNLSTLYMYIIANRTTKEALGDAEGFLSPVINRDDTKDFNEDSFYKNNLRKHGVNSFSTPNPPRLLFARTNKNRILQRPKPSFKELSKIISSSNKVAYLDYNYVNIGTDGTNDYTLDNTQIERPDFIKTFASNPNTRLIFEIDEQSTFYSDIVKKYGKNTPEFYDNAPIKILIENPDGSRTDTKTWIHTLDWVLKNTDIIALPDNIKNIKDIRSLIFSNKSKNVPTYGKISAIENGFLKLNNKIENGKVVIGTNGVPAIESIPIIEALPGLESYGIIESNNVRLSKGDNLDPNDILINVAKDSPTGTLVAVHNDPYSKKKVVIPITTKKLNDKKLKHIKSAISNVIKSYYFDDPSKVGVVKNDIYSLKDYLSNFILLRHYSKRPENNSFIGLYGNNIIIAEANDNEAQIAYGLSTIGDKPYVIKYKNGRAEPSDSSNFKKEAIDEFFNKLDRVLDDTKLSVSLSKINTSGEFKVPSLTPSMNLSSGSNSISYSSYNDFLSKVLTTIFDGRYKTSSGEYSMTSNHPVYFQVDGIDYNSLEDENYKSDTEPVSEEYIEEEFEEEFDRDISDSFSPNVQYNTQFDYKSDYFIEDYKEDIQEQLHLVDNIASSLINLSLEELHFQDKELNLNDLLVRLYEFETNAFNKFKELEKIPYRDAANNRKYAYFLKLFNITSQEDLEAKRKSFYKYYSNFNALSNLAVKKLNSLNLIDGYFVDEFDDEDNINERITYNSKLRLSIDPKSFSKALRVRLSNIPLYTTTIQEDGTRVFSKMTNSLGRPIYANGDVLYNLILELLSNTHEKLNNDLITGVNKDDYFDEVVNLLTEKLDIYPELKGVIDLLTIPQGVVSNLTGTEKEIEEQTKQKRLDYLQSIRTLFVNATFNTKVRQLQIQIYKERGKVKVRNVLINENSAFKAVINSWNNYQKAIGILVKSGNNYIVNKNKVLEIKSEYDNLISSELNKAKVDKKYIPFVNESFLNEFALILSKLGFVQKDGSLIDNNSILDIVKYNKQYKLTSLKAISNYFAAELPTLVIDPKYQNSLFQKLFAHLLSDHTKIDILGDTLFNYGELYPKLIRPLAQSVHNNNELSYSFVSITSDGKIVYEIQKYNSLMSTLRDIKDTVDGTYLDQLLSIPLSKNNPLLNLLKNDPIVRSEFDITFFDALLDKTENDSFKGDVSTKDNLHISSQLQLSFNLYQGGIKYTDAYSFSDYMGLTLGDNPISYVITSIRKDYFPTISSNKDGNIFYSLSNSAIDDVYIRFLGEVNRINTYIKLKDHGVVFNNPSYDMFGGDLIQFAKLNYDNIINYITSEERDKIFIKNEKLSKNKDVYNILVNNETIPILKKAISNFLKLEINSMIESFKNNKVIEVKDKKGVVTFTSNNLDSNYYKIIKSYIDGIIDPIATSTGNYLSIAEKKNLISIFSIYDYFINSYIANLDNQVLFLQDLAHYAKPVKGTSKIDYTATDFAIQKRSRQLVTPFIRGNYIKPYSRFITINDLILKQELEELQKLGYVDTNIVDGLEIATMEEALHDMLAYDFIKKSKFDKLLKRVNDNRGGYYYFTNDDIDVLQVQKPISWDFSFNEEHQTIYPHRIKSSRFYLDPAITKNYPELDKLRIFMENNRIDRAGFESAVKINSKRVLTVFDNNGKFIDSVYEEFNNNIDDYLFIQNYNNTGLVSISPHSKNQISVVVQADRGLFSGIRSLNNFKIKIYNNDGVVEKTMSAIELEELKETIRKKQLDEGFKALKRELDLSIVNGEVVFNDISKVADLLESEGIARNWTLNSLKFLKVGIDGKFKFKLIYNKSLKRIEPVLFSAINKRLVKHKISGSSLVQVPNIGHVKTKVLTLENVNNTQDIIYSEDYIVGSKLKTVSLEDGTVKRAQIIVSWNFKDIDGNLLDINNYIKIVNSRKVIDYSKLPKELLEGIAFRIPNQKHSSMLPFEIVGFLPSYHKDVVIVPNEIVDQMGSDFDIDKLYNYLYKYFVNPVTNEISIIRRGDKQIELIKKELEKAKELLFSLTDKSDIRKRLTALTATLYNFKDEESIEKIKELNNEILNIKKEFANIGIPEEEVSKKLDVVKKLIKNLNSYFNEYSYLNNDYIDVFNSVLTHPGVYKKIVSKLDMDDLLNEVKLLRKNEVSNYANPIHQLNAYIMQQSGKNALSLLALHGSFTSIIEKLSIADFNTKEFLNNGAYLYEIKKNKAVRRYIQVFGRNLANLSGEGGSFYNGVYRSTFDNIVILQNAAVDNANNPLLGISNINEVTLGVAIALVYLKDNFKVSSSIHEIVKFLNTKAVKDIVNEYYINPDYEEINDKYIVIDKIINSLSAKYSKESNIPIDDSLNLDDFNVPIEEYDNYENLSPKEKLKFNLYILRTFGELNNVFGSLDKVRSAILTPSKNGLGKNYSEILYQKFLISNYLVKNENIANVNRTYATEDSLTQYGHYIHNTIYLFAGGLSNIFGYNSELFNSFINSAILNYSKSNISERTFYKLIEFYSTSALSGSKFLLGEDLVNLRASLIYGDNTLAKRLIDLNNMINSTEELADLKNNLFLRSLEPQIEYNNNKFDLVRYNFISKIGIDSNLIARDFYRLLTNSNETVRQFAFDLVKYLFALGLPSTANFQQDIPFEYLEETGMLEVLDSLSLNKKNLLINFYRNNPYAAFNYELLSDNVENIKEEILKYNNISFKSIISFNVEGENRSPEFIYRAEYIKRDGGEFESTYSKKIYSLYYKISERYYKGGYISNYIKISTAGSINLNKTKLIEVNLDNPFAKSIHEENNLGVPEQNRLADPTLPVKINPTYFEKTYLAGNTSYPLHLALNSIVFDKSMSILANVLKRALRVEGISSKISEVTQGKFFGKESNGNVEINFSNILKYTKSKESAVVLLEQTLNHEALHVLLKHKIINYLKGDKSLLTNSEKAALRKLNDIRSDVLSKFLSKKDSVKLVKELEKFNKNETDYLSEDASILYALNSLDEFVTHVLTSNKFQNYLNSIEYTKEKTLLTKIRDLLAKLIEHFIEAIGIKVKDNSALKEAIINALTLIDVNEEMELEPQERNSIEENESIAKPPIQTTIFDVPGVVPNQDSSKLKNSYTFSDGYVVDTKNIQLNAGQQEALRLLESFIKSNNKQFFSLYGAAGTGKSTVLSILKDYLINKTATNINYSSPTHRANAVLYSFGIEDAETIYKLLGLKSNKTIIDNEVIIKFEESGRVKIKDNSILIIDEASMLEDILFDSIKEILRNKNIKVIFVGDIEQLKPVGQKTKSKVFSEVKDFYKLTETKRAGNINLLNEYNHIRNTGLFSGVTNYSNGEGVLFLNSKSEFLDIVKSKFKEIKLSDDPFSIRVLSYTNSMVSYYNNEIRKLLFGNNLKEYYVDEVLTGYISSNLETTIKNSIDYKVLAVSEPTIKTIKNITGKFITLKVQNMFNPSNVFEVNILSKDNDKSVFDDYIKVYDSIYYDPKDSNNIELSNFVNSVLIPIDLSYKNRKGKTINISKSLDYGYAQTIHKSQGGTYKTVLVDATTIFGNDQSEVKSLKYVAATRASKELIVYANKENLSPSVLQESELYKELKDGNLYLTSDINSNMLLEMGYSPVEIGKILKEIC